MYARAVPTLIVAVAQCCTAHADRVLVVPRSIAVRHVFWLEGRNLGVLLGLGQADEEHTAGLRADLTVVRLGEENERYEVSGRSITVGGAASTTRD